MIKVGVIGAAGRMGSETCRAVEAAEGMELVARVGRDDDLSVLVDAGVQVAVEFTEPAAVKDNVRFCVERGIHTVVGATGLTDDDLEDIRSTSDASGAKVFVAPNFAVGAVLMMRFAEQAAPHFRTAEIVERHHERKLDAPSGTALRTAHLMNEARGEAWDAPESSEAAAAARGEGVDGVHVHSLRLPGSVAHQEVILGSPGETLTIRHDSLDRASFMPGVVLAIRKVESLPGLTVGLEHLLGI